MLFVRLFAFISFICVVTCVIAALSRKRKTFFGKAYIFYTALVAGYVLTEFLNISIVYESFNYIVLKTQSIFWILAGSAFYMFSVAVCERKHTNIYRVFLMVSLLLAVVSVSTNLIIEGTGPYASGVDIVPGKFFLPTVFLVVLLPFILGLAELVMYLFKEKKYQKTVSKSALIIFGTLTSVGIAIATDAIIPHILGIETPYRVGASVSVIQTILIYKAIHDKYTSKVRIEDLNHLMYRYSNNPIALIDNEGVITHCNESAYMISKSTYSELYGKKLETVFDDENWKKFSREVVDDSEFQGSIVLMHPKEPS